MLNEIPKKTEMVALIGQDLYPVWQALSAMIEEHYDMERIWNNGGKKWTYEYKYRRGGKTLCAIYAKENCIGFMIVFGKHERAIYEEKRSALSAEVQNIFDQAEVFHDGKWVMFYPIDTSLFSDFFQLLTWKRKPNIKP